MFLTAKRWTVSAPRATEPKSCFVSGNIFVTQVSPEASWATHEAKTTTAVLRTRINIANPLSPFGQGSPHLCELPRLAEKTTLNAPLRLNYRPEMCRRATSAMEVG